MLPYPEDEIAGTSEALETTRLHGLISEQTELSIVTAVRTAATCSRWFLARGFFYPEDGGDTFLRNVGSHGATSQKTAFFIVTAVKTSNLIVDCIPPLNNRVLYSVKCPTFQ
jgi:hypothetical protein